MCINLEKTWREVDNKVAEKFACYNYTVNGKFGDLYGREYNCTTGKFDGEYFLLSYPVRFDRLIYYVTEYCPAVYKLDERTGKYRESKTAYKAIVACEHAIEKAIDKREKIESARDSHINFYSNLMSAFRKAYSFGSL